MNKISGVIVVKNNPKYLFESLTSVLDLVSEFIIIDIGAEEKIKAKLQLFDKVRIVSLVREIPYVELIREESKRFVHGDYILFIDPDEIWMPGLKKIIKTNLGKYDYFLIPRKNLIFGKWIKHSRWWPDYQTRVFKKDKVSWPKEIHSQPKTSGKGLRIETKEELAILHHNYENLDEFFNKMIRYAKAEADDLIKKNKPLTLQETITKSISEFVSRFFAAEGYKDGMHGFVLAFLQMFYCFLVYFYYWEGKKYIDIEKEAKKQHLQINDFFKQGLKETNYWLVKKKLVTLGKQIRMKLLYWLTNIEQ
jgi:(heptosyl)LPS beta-1,4-glucosyltransferase